MKTATLANVGAYSLVVDGDTHYLEKKGEGKVLLPKNDADHLVRFMKSSRREDVLNDVWKSYQKEAASA
jgi:hypothetical protein